MPSEIASSYVTLRMMTDQLAQDLAGAKNVVINNITNIAAEAKNAMSAGSSGGGLFSSLTDELTSGQFGAALATAGKAVGDFTGGLVSGIGDAIKNLPQLAAGFMSAINPINLVKAGVDGVKAAIDVMTGGFSMLLSIAAKPFEILGDVISGTIGKVSEFIGKVVDGFTGPVRAAMASSLTDFQRWVGVAIDAEQASTRFNAVLQSTGEGAGWSGAQLRQMASDMSAAGIQSTGDIMKAQQAIMGFEHVGGEAFRQVLDAAVRFTDAGIFQNVAQGAEIFGRAMEHPEHAMRSLMMAGVSLTQQQKDLLEQFNKAGDVASAQGVILEALAGKYKGVGSEMQGTTAGILAMLSRDWNSIGKSIGESLLPATKMIAQGMDFLVKELKSILGPVIEGIKEEVKGLVSSISGFFGSGENVATFKEWADTIKEIATNVFNQIRAKVKEWAGDFRDAMSGLAGDSGVTWNTIKNGISSFLNTAAAMTADLPKGFDAAWTAIKLGVSMLADESKPYWEQFKIVAKGAFDAMELMADAAFKNIIEKFKAAVMESIPILRNLSPEVADALMQGAGAGGVGGGALGAGPAPQNLQEQLAQLADDIAQKLAAVQGAQEGEATKQLKAQLEKQLAELQQIREQLAENNKQDKAKVKMDPGAQKKPPDQGEQLPGSSSFQDLWMKNQMDALSPEPKKEEEDPAKQQLKILEQIRDAIQGGVLEKLDKVDTDIKDGNNKFAGLA